MKEIRVEDMSQRELVQLWEALDKIITDLEMASDVYQKVRQDANNELDKVVKRYYK